MPIECAVPLADSPLRIRTILRSLFSTTPMNRRSAQSAQLFGIILMVLICAWDMDAMRPHIAAHSWATLAFVSLYLAVHLLNYLTVGRLIHRLDPLFFANSLGFTQADAMAPLAIPIAERRSSGQAAQTAA